MRNELDYRFSIRRLDKSTDSDYAAALKIYSETTPYEIKTNTNEITIWLDRKDSTDPFESMFFVLYYSEKLAGFAMMTYIKAQRIVVLEYIALETQYRVNTVFFTYINLLESYLHINQYDVAFILNEVSNRRNGSDIDKESQIFSKLLCIEGFGKIDAPYVTPPLGTNNFESSFDAFLFAKSSGDVHALERQTYLEIVKAIYFDYFLVWYKHVLPPDQVNEYNEILQKSFEAISRKLSTNTIGLGGSCSPVGELIDGSMFCIEYDKDCGISETNPVQILPPDEGVTTDVIVSDGTCAMIYYDVNGSEKPNLAGKDQFVIPVRKTGVRVQATNN